MKYPANHSSALPRDHVNTTDDHGWPLPWSVGCGLNGQRSPSKVISFFNRAKFQAMTAGVNIATDYIPCTINRIVERIWGFNLGPWTINP